jgi:hypothetical protein
MKLHDIILQATTGELNKKQPVLSALGDIVSQLTKMADDSVMSAADESVKQLGSQLNELLERMNGRKTYLQVFMNACFIAAILYVILFCLRYNVAIVRNSLFYLKLYHS